MRQIVMKYLEKRGRVVLSHRNRLLCRSISSSADCASSSVSITSSLPLGSVTLMDKDSAETSIRASLAASSRSLAAAIAALPVAFSIFNGSAGADELGQCGRREVSAAGLGHAGVLLGCSRSILLPVDSSGVAV